MRCICINLLLSINYKFFHVGPAELIDIIKDCDNYKVVQGMEVYIRPSEHADFAYVKELIPILKKENWTLQIHGPTIDLLDSALLEKYVHLANMMNYHLLITTHPTEKMKESVDFYKHLEIITRDLPVDILVENLNNLGDVVRLHVADIRQICQQIPTLNMCWDVGHETMSGPFRHCLPTELINRVRNVHIHDITELEDHHPFIHGNVDYFETLKNLNHYNYNGNIVLEIALDYLPGNSFKDKMRAYVGEFLKFIEKNPSDML